MKTYFGGESVKGGFYFGSQQKDILDINDNETLPGGSENHYWRIPLILMLLAGPLMGLVYVIFLPFISFAMVFSVLTKKAFGHVKVLGHELFANATTAWRPGYSFLATQDPESKPSEKVPSAPKTLSPTKTPEDRLADLEKEIVELRKEGQQ